MKLTFFDVRDIFQAMKPGGMRQIECGADVIDRMTGTYEDCEFKPVDGLADTFILIRKRPNLRREVHRLCRELAFTYTEVPFNIQASYLRSLVWQYNLIAGANVRVSARNGRLYLHEDIQERISITEAEFQAFKAKLGELEYIATRKVLTQYVEYDDENNE